MHTYTHGEQMARITVYIPDERMPDIEKWREKTNFSQIFIEAFDRAIQSQKPKLKESEMKATVQRLKRASGQTFESGWKEGVKLGTAWAIKHSHLSHLQRIGEGILAFEKDGDDVVRFLNFYYEHEGYCRTPDDEREDMEYERWGGDAETYARGRNAGFVEAAKNVWEDIRSEFEG